MKKTMSAKPAPKTKTVPRNEAEAKWVDPSKLGLGNRAFFKPEAGKTHRIHLMGKPAYAHVQFLGKGGAVKSFSTYEIDANGNETQLEAGLDEELLQREPQQLWCVPVLVYSSNNKGVVLAKNPSDIEYEFKLWSFSKGNYRKLYNLAAEYGDDFSNKDLLVTGGEGQFPRAEIVVAAQNALSLNSKIAGTIESEFAGYKFKDANRWMAREMTEDEFRDAIASMDDAPNSRSEE